MLSLLTFKTDGASLCFFNSPTKKFLYKPILSKIRSLPVSYCSLHNLRRERGVTWVHTAFFSRCITFFKEDFQNVKGSQYLNTISRHLRKHNTNEQTDSKLERNDRRSSSHELSLRPTQGENFASKLLHITSSAT